MSQRRGERWNHNLHYHGLVRAAVPAANGAGVHDLEIVHGDVFAHPCEPESFDAVVSRLLRRWRRHVEPASPTVWPPPESYASQRAIAARELPGARMRRLVLFRYLLVWTKPEGSRA